MKNICIATPSYDGKVTVEYLSSMMDYTLNTNFGIECVILSNDSLITRIRNALFTDFYEKLNEKKYSYLIWQDSDVYMTHRGLNNLLSYDLDVIGVAVPLKSDNAGYGITCAVHNVYEKVDNFLYKTEYLGTGLMALSRKAVLDLVRYCDDNNEWYWDSIKKRKIYDVFKVGVNKEKVYESEDWYLCSLLRKIGYEIYVDSSSDVGHMSFLRKSMEINPEAINKRFSGPLPESKRSLFWTTNDWLDFSIPDKLK